ncbi:MAG TPA: glycosyltransferase family 39 protein [Vicinamibacterales bacterium]
MFHVIVAVFAVFGTLWALAIWLVGGFTVPLPGVAIESHDPLRPLAVGAIAALIYLVARGPLNLRRVTTPLAILLALCPAIAGIARNSWTAGGADQYAYVSQADLWLQRDLTVPIPLAATAPWPEALLTFMPHGFRPAVTGPALVPVTAPGLPLLMAGAKTIAGHCAMFLVTPLTGALLVWITFLIGRRMDSGALGLAAAWLVATSPAVLAMLVSPMSDVPAAAFWAIAIYFTLGHTPRSALLAGLAASAAIMIRPNLAPFAVVLVLWKFWSEQRAEGRELKTSSAQRFTPVLLLIVGTVPGCLFIAWINHALYGSPLASGYGSLSALFSVSYILPNFERYGRWLLVSQTPLAAVGIAILLVPAKAIWRTREQQRAARLLGASVIVVWALYLIYTPFEAWWFLRFLLPSWPAMCLGSAAVLVRAARARHVTLRILACALLVLVGVQNLYYASTHGAFPSGEGEHRYVSIAKMVEQATDPSAVIFTGQHSGPIRYYAGRTTIRFDLLDQAWLDRAVQWLNAQGRGPYFLLEEWEVTEFQNRFSASNALGTIALAPVVDYRAPGVPGRIYLFDPAHPEGGDLITTPPVSAQGKCVGPSPLLHLR